MGRGEGKVGANDRQNEMNGKERRNDFFKNGDMFHLCASST